MFINPTISYIDIGRVILLLATFAYASKLDIKNRTVPHKTWIIPLLFGCLFLNLQLYTTITPQTTITKIYSISYLLLTITAGIGILITVYDFSQSNKTHTAVWSIPFGTTIAILSLGIIFKLLGIVPLQPTYFHLTTTIFTNIAVAILLGLILHLFPAIGMGGADFMAFVIIGVLLPTTPELGPLPYMTAPTIPFPHSLVTLEIMTIITNTGFILLVYLPTLPIKNYLRGHTDKPFLTAFTTKVPLEELHNTHGRVIATWNLENASLKEKLKIYFTGLDTSFLHDYLKWRKEVADTPPEDFTDESSVYIQQFIETHREVLGLEDKLDEGEKKWGTDNLKQDEEFLRKMLQQDSLRIMPGLPFIVPLFGGILTAITIGDIMLLVLLTLNSFF